MLATDTIGDVLKHLEINNQETIDELNRQQIDLRALLAFQPENWGDLEISLGPMLKLREYVNYVRENKR